MKAKLHSITLTRAEGPTILCDKPVSVSTFSDANITLRRWADTAPKHGGYDKCDVSIEWSDGTTYGLRYDLVHWTVESPDLKKQLRYSNRYYCGDYRPDHMSEEEYKRSLSRPMWKDIIEFHRRLRDACEIEEAL
jgi:hypothetical protein